MAPRAKKVTSPSGQRVEIGEKGVSNKDPFYGSVYLRRYASYLGQWDPSSLGIATMLKMQHHPAISLAEHVIWSPLVNADWDIECGDPVKKRFIRGVIEPIYQKLMLFSLPAITLGFAAYTKQWGNYQPYDEDGKPLWPKTLADDGVLPVVPIDLKQLDPLSVQPIVENDEFKGIRQDGFGDIEPLYSVWVTHHRHKVWGNLWGWPLLTNVYSWWWSSGFRQALMNRHIEDRVSPPIVVYYPPGFVEDPDTGERISFRQAALDSGKAVRAGETLAMPSDWYVDENGKPFSPKWKVEFLKGGENVQAFVDLEDASDIRILMGMLIPPQALLQAKGGIGSQSVAETLGEVFWTSQRIRKQEMDGQITDYVIEPIERLNWPQGPRARLVTRRFHQEDQRIVFDLLKILVNRSDLDPTKLLDLKSLIRRSGFPAGHMEGLIKAPQVRENIPAPGSDHERRSGQDAAQREV